MQRCSVPSPRRTRRGFSLIAVTVTIMIVATIAVVAIPYTTPSDHQLAATRTAQILRTLELNLTNSSAFNGSAGFCVQVGVCPKLLTHLTTAITGSDLACTGTAYTVGSNKQTGKWPGDGTATNIAPYTALPVSPGRGVWTPLGMIHDTVIKVTTAIVELHIDSLLADDASYLDRIVDGTADSAAGLLRYDSTAVNTSHQKFRLIRYRISNTNVSC
jgi:type II secretory pathway pseudopilin PulG